MISAREALKTVLSHSISCSSEEVNLLEATGRVLKEDLLADRDFPAHNRATMDGIALNTKNLKPQDNVFFIKSVLPAGASPKVELKKDECVQIMTGASLPAGTNTVVPIENIKIKDGSAYFVNAGIKKGQYIHHQGADSKKSARLVSHGAVISPSIIPIAASIGKTKLKVAKPPKTLVISTGDELVDITKKPMHHQIRKSNNFLVASLLLPLKVDFMHLKDDKKIINNALKHALNTYELIIISGGVSKGEYDFIPEVLRRLGVKIHFHGVAQKPGKPLLFANKPDGATIFALPGNPISTYLCTIKYILPWLQKSLGAKSNKKIFAQLDKDVIFEAKKTYFLQVNLKVNAGGTLLAQPIAHHGSGDFISMAGTNSFIELPANRSVFKKGSAYPVISPIGSIL